VAITRKSRKSLATPESNRAILFRELKPLFPEAWAPLKSRLHTFFKMYQLLLQAA
jgi:hypothetical protein